MSEIKSSGNNESMVITNAKSVTLGDFVKKTSQIIKIPPNQRPYAWEKTQVDDFLRDLESTRKEREESHFFNLITFLREKKGSVIEVQDGQQRITTVILTISVFYKIHTCIIDKQRDNHMSSAEIVQEHVERNEYYKSFIFNKNGKKRLELYSKNEDMISKVIETHFINKDNFLEQIRPTIENGLKTESNDKIFNAIKEIIMFPENQHSGDYIANGEYKTYAIKLIEEYLDTLINKFQVIQAEIKDEKSTYKIFELVNSRGVALSEFDKAKNYIYQIAISTGGNQAVSKVTKIIEKLFEKLGDDAEEAFSLHWVVFFNRSTTKSRKLGDYKNIFQSLKYRIEYIERKNDKTAHKYDTKENMRDKLFAFLGDLEKNLDNICMFYKFIKMEAVEFEADQIFRTKIRRDLNDEDVFSLYTYYKLTDKYNYSYTKNFFYYLFIRHLNDSVKDFNIKTEFKKVTAFYLSNSIVNNRMSHLDTLNNSMGYRLNMLENRNDFDINYLFCEFLLGEDKESEYVDILDIEELKNKISVAEYDVTAEYVRLIFLFIYDSIEGGNIFNRYFPKDKHGKRQIIQQEHIFPNADLKESSKFGRFNLHNVNSELRRRKEWLGNKLLLSREENSDVGESIEYKLEVYINSDDEIVNEYALIFASVFEEKPLAGREINVLRQRGASAATEILSKFEQNPDKNEELGLKIEEEWRNRIGEWYKERDLLDISGMKRILEDIKSSKEV